MIPIGLLLILIIAFLPDDKSRRSRKVDGQQAEKNASLLRHVHSLQSDLDIIKAQYTQLLSELKPSGVGPALAATPKPPAEISKYQDELKAVTAKLAALQADIACAKTADTGRFQEHLADLDAARRDLNSLRGAYEGLRKVIQANETEGARVSQELDTLRQQRTDLESRFLELSGLVKTESTFAQDLDTLKEQYARISRAIESDSGAGGALAKKLAKEINERESLASELSQAGLKHQSQISLLDKKIDSLAKSVAALSADAGPSRQDFGAALQLELGRLKEECVVLRQGFEAAGAGAALLEKELAGEREERVRLGREIERLNKARQEQAVDLESKSGELEKKIQEQIGRIAAGTDPSGLESLRQELIGLKSQYEQIGREFERTQRRADFIETKLAAGETERLRISGELQDLRDVRVEQSGALEKRLLQIQDLIDRSLKSQAGMSQVHFQAEMDQMKPSQPAVQPPAAVERVEAPSQKTLSPASADLSSEGLLSRRYKKKKIGEVLLENKLINKEMFDEAVQYQEKFGGGITQYLIAFGYITEDDLARCVSAQFGVPYLSAKMYAIPPDITKIVPVDIVQKYCLMPVDQQGGVLTVIMADPLDTTALSRLQEATGLVVQAYVGVVSDILDSIEEYYHVSVAEKKTVDGKKIPMLVHRDDYIGRERREAVRFAAALDISFFYDGKPVKVKTKDVSSTGILFEAGINPQSGALLDVQIALPKDFYPRPIEVAAQVARVLIKEAGIFNVGVRFTRIKKDELEAVMEYAKKLCAQPSK